MTESKELQTEIIAELFNINGEVILTKEEFSYLCALEQTVLNSFAVHGEDGIDSIKSEATDTLLKNGYGNLIKYLNLEIPESITGAIDSRVDDKDYLEIEEGEKSDDFFNTYLVDELINDIFYSLLGYEKKSVGNKDFFKKKRGSLLPTIWIDAIKITIIASNEAVMKQVGLFELKNNLTTRCCYISCLSDNRSMSSLSSFTSNLSAGVFN